MKKRMWTTSLLLSISIVALVIAGCDSIRELFIDPDETEIQALLIYAPAGSDKWWLSFRVNVNDASRVYVTGDYIDGTYDLFKCGTSYGRDDWLSTNNPQCAHGNDNYNIGEEPALPINLVIHVVLPSQEDQHAVQINSYELL